MATEITLQIYTPERTVMNRRVYRVVLPYGRVNLTVMDGRAPTSLVLPAGKIDILAANHQIEASYFIDGGVVDIAENLCKLSTRHIIKTTAITKAQAEEYKQNEPQNEAFYNMIINTLKTTEADDEM